MVGYSLWTIKFSSAVFKGFLRPILSVLFGLLRGKKKNPTKNKESFTKENQARLINEIRRGTKGFLWGGIIVGLGFVAIKYLFGEDTIPNTVNAIIIGYSFIWGYFLNKLAWFGYLPWPMGTED